MESRSRRWSRWPGWPSWKRASPVRWSALGAGLRGELRDVFSDCAEGLYPARCPVCRVALTVGSAGCDLHRLPDPGRGPPGSRCGRCAQALPPMLPNGDRCAACRLRPPRFRRIVTLGDYREDDGLRHWILAFKHGGRRDLAQPLGVALGERLRSCVSGPVLLVPVPLHPLRRFERGYDQALLLARETAEAVGGTCRSLLVRRAWTAPQGSVGGVSRSANVHDAFQARAGTPVDLLGVSVWLVDDVVTSGATVESCIGALLGLGARRVSVLCLARAGHGSPAVRGSSMNPGSVEASSRAGE